LFYATISFSENKPNIVYINIDDFSWTGLSSSRSSYYETPNIDLLATMGMKFTNVDACNIGWSN